MHDGPGGGQVSGAATRAVSHHAFPHVGMCACGAAGGGIFLICLMSELHWCVASGSERRFSISYRGNIRRQTHPFAMLTERVVN